ncbi:hypothetical protein LUZ61_018419 [Rhynchospora tenuis]|uniref:Uncharacterized protein n=1 Tax=Rhynchospora tenuis TaxID=198213 RepID=A0AAD5Z9E2_9POAL|nr:hypothetical protein LUZ61_018419 [Rhynchospora tenuis]
MGFINGLFGMGGKKGREMEAEADCEPISGLSSIASSVVHRCARILGMQTDKLVQLFEIELPDHASEPEKYGRDLLLYCSYKALNEETKSINYLSEKEFRILTFDMMLAWETPNAENDSSNKENNNNKKKEAEEDEADSLFCSSATKNAIQVDGKKTVSSEAFARIAPACPIIADPITVNNLFESLTSYCGGRLHFLIYDKYIKYLEKVVKVAKTTAPHAASLNLSEGEIILDVDGVSATNSVFQHIGTSTRPGRLTLTNRAIYFEPLGVGFSYGKPISYDLEKDLKQVVKRECTGPWGARLFDKAVMYKSSFLTEPVFIEFPQFKGQARRDYWFAIIKEILHAHKFIRKFNLSGLKKAEILSEATLGVFRYRALKEAFHIMPSQVKSTLSFYLAEKLPKGDKILDALYNHLETLFTGSESNPQPGPGSGSFPPAICTIQSFGFILSDKAVEFGFYGLNIDSGPSSLELAVRRSASYSGRAEAARATLEQVKMEDIDTNVAVLKELLFPLMQIGELMLSLVEWEDPFKSHVFLVLFLFLVYRGWIRYIIPCIFLTCSGFIMWNKHHRKGRPIEAFQVPPPKHKSTVEQLLTLQETISKLEMGIQEGNITLLKLRAILFAAFPQTTNKIAITLVAMAVFFMLLSFKDILLLILLEEYTRKMPLRRESSEKLVRRLREWWGRIPAAPVQLMKRHESRR